MHILVINPGSTSTKIAVFDNSTNIFLKNIQHSIDELSKFTSVANQYIFRKQQILDVLKNAEFSLAEIKIVVGRGGLLKPMESGVYHVNDALIRDIKNPMAEHASNLGGFLAKEIADIIGNNVQAYIADPTCVDELEDIARFSGLPQLPRKSFLHTLNQKAVARHFASEIKMNYEDLNLIVTHLGGGITVGAHRKGKIVNVNNGLDGDGPFSPERAGTLPAGQLVDMCFSKQYSYVEIRRMINGKGGLVAYLGTNNAIEIEEMIQKGNKNAELVFTAMAYQVAQSIGAMATVLKGEVDAILLTGGLAFNNYLTKMISERVSFISIIRIYPGEDEMKALAANGLLILNGKLKAKEYI